MRLRTFIHLVFIVFVLFAAKLHSQSLANYSSSRNTGISYTSINLSGNAFSSWRNNGTGVEDDNRSDFVNIGFDFWYNGARYTRFSASTNGYLDFSSSVEIGTGGNAFGYDNSCFTGNNVNQLTGTAVAPFYDNLATQNGTVALGSSIKYSLSGSAPSRTLTIEWINMTGSANHTPNLNFQVKIVETIGVIFVNYGNMNAGTNTFSYSMGLNSTPMGAVPLPSQLKTLLTTNSNTFTYTPTNALAALPAAGSQYIFTPLVPTAPSGSVTLTGITQNAMTVNWPNWASNEVGYVIYNSTDNVNFNFISQTLANVTNTVITGLLPTTTYYWKVCAVTEGCLSAAITGSATTLAAGNKISIATGMWGTATTWSPTGVPTAGDNVTIANGHLVTINANAVCNNLTVGQGLSGMLTIGNNNTARTIAMTGSLTVNTGGAFNVASTSNGVHSLTLTSNVINNGTINFRPDANSLCNVTFNYNGNQTISGTGAVSTFNLMNVSLGTSVNNILDIQTPSFSVPRDFLILNYGTFKLSTTGASAITPYSSSATIAVNTGIWINSAPSTVNMLSSVTLNGNMILTNGILNIGDLANEDLISNGGSLTISNGTLNIAGKYYPFATNSLSNFTMSGGNLVVPFIGSSNTTIAPFQITGVGSLYNVSGGSIIIPREGGSGAQDMGYVNTANVSGSVTGGTLQIGNSASPATQIIKINSVNPVGNLLVSSANITASVTTNSLSVNNDVTINAGTLSAAGQTLSLGGNWNNNAGVFVPGAGNVTFAGTSAQTIFKATGEVFNNISFSNAGNKTLLSSITANTLTINGGSLTANNFSISLTGNWVNNGGTFVPGTGTTIFTNTLTQTIFKSGGETFNNVIFSGTGNKSLLSAISVNTLTINAGTLTANSSSITLTGNWTNNGGLFVPGTNTTLFTGTSAQTIFKTGGEIFNNVSFANAGVKTLLSAMTASNVIINTGSSLNVNTTNNQVNVRGDFLNSGTFTAQKGLVMLNGTVAQNIGGSSITNFYNLSLSNTAGATLTNAENLINTLTLSNGTFNTNAKAFTMVSTASNTARVATITGTGDIIGNVTVQRHAPGGYTGWALLGTPISSGLTFQSWNDDFPISCPSCPNGTAGGFTSIYAYNEAAAGVYSVSTAYVPISSITNAILPNKGYWVYLGNGQTSTTPVTIDVIGSLRKFNNVISLTKTNTGSVSDDGWNLIHNPYPSPIKWSSLRNGNPSVDNAIYGYNADLNGGLGSTVAFVNGISSPAIGAGGISDTIPMCQGFQVHCTASTNLTALETHKVSGNPSFLKVNQTTQVATTQQLLRLHLYGPTSFHDETVLYIQPGATQNFDSEYDAIKMIGQDPNAPLITLQSGTDEFQVNGVSSITSSFSMPLKTTTGYNGTYTISAANFNSFPTGACISLYDSFNGTTTNLKTNNYVFTLNSSTANPRFVLNITIDPLDITSQLSQPNCIDPNSGMIRAIGNNAGPWNYSWKDVNGVTVKTSLNKSTADTLTNLSGGDYSLEINTVGQCDNHDSTFTVDIVEMSSAQFTSVDTTYLSNGGLVQFTNNSMNAMNNTWDFGDSFGTSSVINPDYNYSSAGIYTVTLISASNSGCLDTAYKSVVVVSDMIVTGLANNNSKGLLLLKTLDQNEYLLQGALEGNENLSFKLYDGFGKIVADYGNLNSSAIHVPLNLKNLKVGLYFLNITGGKTQQSIKLPVTK
ncbi:MAG: hypothetical protein K0S53_3114 [Bacteroidetes bacterium]|nr:hypothetical protein [Bacteroidota bacterium]